MVSCLEDLGDDNLLLIQSYEFHLEKREISDRDIGRTTRESLISLEAVEQRLRELPDDLPDEYRLNDETVERCRSQDDEHAKLSAMIRAMYADCFGVVVELSPLGMLHNVEQQLEELYAQSSLISPDFITQKNAEHEKKRREEGRIRKQIRAVHEQRIKMEHTLARASRPVHKPAGRPLMARSLPPQAQVVDLATLAALKEQQRINALLYGSDE
jgi:hypothetical protein